MIQATRNHFFVDTVIKVRNERALNYAKYPQYDISPYLIQEAPWAVISIIALGLITQILKFLDYFGFNVTRILKIARETKSSVMIFSVVPYMVHGIHNLYDQSFSKNKSFWSFLNMIAFTIIGIMYMVKNAKYLLSIMDIKYLHAK
jgi:hypothetical protein